MSVDQLLPLLTQGTVILITLFAFLEYLRHGGRARFDIFLMFGDLALIVFTQWISEIFGSQVRWAGLTGSILLVAHPYLLLLLVEHLRPVPRGIRLFALSGMLVSWAFILGFPSALPIPVTVLIVVYFAFVEIYCVLVLVQGARVTRGVSHWRLLLAATGSSLIALLILLSGMSAVFTAAAPVLIPLSQLVGLLSVICYYLGFASPSWLRRSWQLSELHLFLSKASGQWVAAGTKSILDRLCSAAERAVGGYLAAAALVDEQQSQLIVRAFSRPDRFPVSQPITSETVEMVWREQQPALIHIPADLMPEPTPGGTGMLLVVPVATQERAWGLLIVFLRRAPLFAQDDLALLSLFCEQTAIELGYLQLLSEQRTLIDQLSRSTERLEALNDMDRAILAVSSPQEIASAALPRLRKLVPSQRASVIFFDFEQRQATYIAVDSDEELGPPPGTVLPLDHFPTRVSGNPSQEYIQDLADFPLRSPLIQRLLEKQIRSLLTLPIISEGALFGELALSSRKISAFQPEHIMVAQEVSNQLAIAIQQANLRNKLQCYAADLEQRVAERSAELTARSVQLEAVVRDLQEEIAARKQAEENIRRLNAGLRQQTADLNAANKELEAFAYSISHDLRAPLRSIEGFSRILLNEYTSELNGEALHYLELVRDNAQEMGRLIEDLLTFSRLNRQPLSKQRVQPNDVVRVVMWDLLKGQAKRRIETKIQEMPSCSADPVLLKQVYMNLLSNAIKFSAPREITQIEVGCLPQNGDKVYFIKDNGVGFDMRFAGRLFEVFQRLHKPEEFEGTGVGLAIVQRIIERHGGRVWAESEVDRGAVFYFTLPKEPEAQAEPTPEV